MEQFPAALGHGEHRVVVQTLDEPADSIGHGAIVLLYGGPVQRGTGGTGLPTVDNTHEVAQRVNPACRIVYVDNDPLVLVHARALLASTAEGACDYVDADVREPEVILERAARTLDFGRPVALMMLGILGNVWDDGEARAIRERLVGALPVGSYLVLNDGTDTVDTEAANDAEATRAEAGRGG